MSPAATPARRCALVLFVLLACAALVTDAPAQATPPTEATASATPEPMAVSTKDLADAYVRLVRARQDSDGGYGADLHTTCRVLDLLGRSPRRYTDVDGPFMRRAARLVAQDEDRELDAWRVLALAGSLMPAHVAAREASLERVLARPQTTSFEPSYAELLVRWSYAPDTVATRSSPDVEDAALACLLAVDPDAVSAPAPDDGAAWARWARAARLRGMLPTRFPELALPDPTADLETLLVGLEAVVVADGLIDAPAPPPFVPAERVTTPAPLPEAVTSALEYLEGQQQGGTVGLGLPGWQGSEAGVTALVLSATIRWSQRLGLDRPAWVDAGLDHLAGLQRPDGAIHDIGPAVYTTAVAIGALIDGGRTHDLEVVERARRFLIEAQADEGEGYSIEEDSAYGGIGYGGDERPDLSNTNLALEAIALSGTPGDHEVFDKALHYLEQCQNLGERSPREWRRPGGGRLVSGTDGGATYMPGNSAAGEVEVGDGVFVARSYGSMTYALAKSYVFCGVRRGDPRLEACIAWLGEHFTVERNPGFAEPAQGFQGLYYYYLALARTLGMLVEGTFTDPEGRVIPWRDALTEQLLGEQRLDGSWTNTGASRWWESSPTLCTAYALLALEAAAP